MTLADRIREVAVRAIEKVWGRRADEQLYGVGIVVVGDDVIDVPIRTVCQIALHFVRAIVNGSVDQLAILDEGTRAVKAEQRDKVRRLAARTAAYFPQVDDEAIDRATDRLIERMSRRRNLYHRLDLEVPGSRAFMPSCCLLGLRDQRPVGGRMTGHTIPEAVIRHVWPERHRHPPPPSSAPCFLREDIAHVKTAAGRRPGMSPASAQLLCRLADRVACQLIEDSARLLHDSEAMEDLPVTHVVHLLTEGLGLDPLPTVGCGCPICCNALPQPAALPESPELAIDLRWKRVGAVRDGLDRVADRMVSSMVMSQRFPGRIRFPARHTIPSYADEAAALNQKPLPRFTRGGAPAGSTLVLRETGEPLPLPLPLEQGKVNGKGKGKGKGNGKGKGKGTKRALPVDEGPVFPVPRSRSTVLIHDRRLTSLRRAFERGALEQLCRRASRPPP